MKGLRNHKPSTNAEASKVRIMDQSKELRRSSPPPPPPQLQRHRLNGSQRTGAPPVLSKTSCCAPASSGRPRLPPRHTPRSPAASTAAAGRPSSRSAAFPGSSRWGRRCCLRAQKKGGGSASAGAWFLVPGPTFGGLEQVDAGLDLGPVLALLLWAVFHHQLVELHGDDVMVVWETAAVCQEAGSRK